MKLFDETHHKYNTIKEYIKLLTSNSNKTFFIDSTSKSNLINFCTGSGNLLGMLLIVSRVLVSLKINNHNFKFNKIKINHTDCLYIQLIHFKLQTIIPVHNLFQLELFYQAF